MILLALFFAYDDEGIRNFRLYIEEHIFDFPPILRFTVSIFLQIVFLESLDRFESAELRVVLHETVA